MANLISVFLSICILSVFLLAGKFLRAKVKLFQRIFLPASIIGGFLGLVGGPFILDLIPPDIMTTWQQLPGILINLVFATLFLGVFIPGVKTLWSQGGSQLCFGMVIGSGQYFVGLLVTVLLLTPLFNVPHAFGTILEIGFAGGHGTAAGMEEVFNQIGFPAGSALAYMSATVGIIVAVVGGIFYINIAIRKGYCKNIDASKGIPEYKKSGLIKNEEDRYTISTATVATESIEPLAFHFAIVALAVLIGWGLLFFVKKIHPVLQGFPLFPLAMIGGMIVQIISKPLKVDRYYDKKSFDRILGISLDLLVVAAISSLKLDLFLANVWPFLILMLTGIAWVFFCLIYLAPRMLPQNWFERGITEYGMQTGVTAIGLLLLRLVDPEYKTDTAQAFGFKQMLYEPFFGGGFITATAPFIVIGMGVWNSIIFAALLMIGFFLLSWVNGWVNLKPVRKA
ncbi:MAG: sodium:glutamate symporter [Bacteroidales bacterium]|nr:sodium:glutamate symporter [Bacteroidales bacterium]